MIKLSSLIIKEEKEAFRLEKEGKLYVDTEKQSFGYSLHIYSKDQSDIESKKYYKGYMNLAKDMPDEMEGSMPWKHGYLLVDHIKVNTKKEGYGYILYKTALKLAQSEGYSGLCSYKKGRSNDASDMWEKIVTFSDNYYDYVNIKDLGTHLTESKELLNDDTSDLMKMEPFFKDHPSLKTKLNSSYGNPFRPKYTDNGAFFDFVSCLSELAPDIMVGRFDPKSKTLVLNFVQSFDPSTSLILKKVVKQLGVKKIKRYNMDDTEDVFDKKKIKGEVPDKVFHGTSTAHLPDIFQNGLWPGKGDSKFEKQGITHETEIFFTADFNESKFYATNAVASVRGFPAVLELNIPDKDLLKPDFDADMTSTKTRYYPQKPPEHINKTDMKPMGISREQGKWGYSGRIPAKFIKWVYLYREYDKKWLKFRPVTIQNLLLNWGEDGFYRYGIGG